MENVYSKVSTILTEKLGIAEAQIRPNSNFTKDLGIDSLDYVELILEFEDVFDIHISDTEGDHIKTVGDASMYIEQKLNEIN